MKNKLTLSFLVSSFLFSNAYAFSFEQHLKNKSSSEITKILHEYTVQPQKYCQTKSCHRLRVLSYREAREYLFGKIHLRNNGSEYFIKDVYCQKTYDEDDFGSGRGPGVMRIPDHNVLNAEHTWPKARFNGRISRSTQVSDLHNLYPSDNKHNSMRGHLLFGEVEHNGKSLPCGQNFIGRSITNQSLTVYEPPNSHKGNVARAIFYFAIRYQLDINDDEEKALKKWHFEDPVDEDERRRNEIISQVQGNRNPFIDEPELVNFINNF